LYTHVILVLVVFALSVVMIMSGRGGGNFYVLALVLGGIPVHTAATTSQFILLSSALAGAAFFGKAKAVSWPLASFFGGLNASMAFLGGFEAHLFSGSTLKVVLSVLLAIAGATMLFPEREGRKRANPNRGYWNLRENEAIYVVDLRLAVPLTMATGFFSGMVGISGGSFLVPLMVVGCGVPMRTAVGTATALLAATALAGFSGNALHGGFEASLAVPGAVAAVAGGLLGGRIALKTKPKELKSVSGVITMIAAAFMMANALSER
jgi:uncharacterized membrane protein YfcA